jgi:nucleoside-diphosphate-sugar epimerase
MYIDDCLRGTELLMQSDFVDPLNIGSDEMVSINQLVDIVEEIAGVRLKRSYKLDAPKGVRGRKNRCLVLSDCSWLTPRGLMTAAGSLAPNDPVRCRSSKY